MGLPGGVHCLVPLETHRRPGAVAQGRADDQRQAAQPRAWLDVEELIPGMPCREAEQEAVRRGLPVFLSNQYRVGQLPGRVRCCATSRAGPSSVYTSQRSDNGKILAPPDEVVEGLLRDGHLVDIIDPFAASALGCCCSSSTRPPWRDCRGARPHQRPVGRDRVRAVRAPAPVQAAGGGDATLWVHPPRPDLRQLQRAVLHRLLRQLDHHARPPRASRGAAESRDDHHGLLNEWRRCRGRHHPRAVGLSSFCGLVFM